MGDLVRMKDWKRGANPPASKPFGSPTEETIRKGPKYPIPEHLKGRPEPIVSLIISYVRTDPEIQREIAKMRENRNCWHYATIAKKVTPEDRVWGVMLVEAIISTGALHHILDNGPCADGIVSYRALQRICEAAMAEQNLRNG